jgi:hypothetical protein
MHRKLQSENLKITTYLEERDIIKLDLGSRYEEETKVHIAAHKV